MLRQVVAIGLGVSPLIYRLGHSSCCLDAIAASNNPTVNYLSLNEAADKHAPKASHLPASFSCLTAAIVEKENNNRKQREDTVGIVYTHKCKSHRRQV